MNYIVFDMEWNQPNPGDKLVYRNDMCLNNEIIQIGAVKMTEKCEITDTFQINIKPSVLKSINHNIRKLTGIDNKMLKNENSLGEAIEKFKDWCGQDYVFIAWGYDDIYVLGNNLKYFSMDTSWLPECYNLQMIFCSQTDNENRQYSLSYAAEYFKINMNKPLHNALTDAYYTALICEKLDMSAGISSYRAMVFKDKSIPEHMKNIVYKRNYTPENKYEMIVGKCSLDTPVCCKCGEKLKISDRANNGFFHYLVIGICSKHGKYAHMYKIHKVDENTYNATEQCFALDKYNTEYFNMRIKKMRASDEKRRRSTSLPTARRMTEAK